MARRKPRVGRPPLPPGEAKHARLEIRLTPEERELIGRAAEKTGDTVSDYVRESVLVTAREELGLDPIDRAEPAP